MSSEDSTFKVISSVLIVYLLFNQSSKPIQEKVVYFRYCEDLQHNTFSCPGSTGVLEKRFMIFIDRQIVAVKGPIPYKLENCAVFDVDNWQCDKDNGEYVGIWSTGFVEKTKGSIDQRGEKSSLPLLLQISRIDYYIQSSVDFFRGLLRLLK